MFGQESSSTVHVFNFIPFSFFFFFFSHAPSASLSVALSHANKFFVAMRMVISDFLPAKLC